MTPPEGAKRLYEDFTDLAYDKAFDGDIPQPTKLEMLGPIQSVVYISNKWMKTERREGTKKEWMKYVHEFRHNAPMLCFDPADKKSFHILGKVKVLPEGVTDFKGKVPSLRRPNYSIPKKVAFLGYLDEVVYESIKDEEDYRLKFPKSTALCSDPSGLHVFIVRLKAKRGSGQGT